MVSMKAAGIPDHPRNHGMLEAVKAAAMEYEEKDIAELPFSVYIIYFETGSRIEYEACYIDHRRRLNVYTAMALADEDDCWRKGLENILWAICNEFTWAFPAHIKEAENLKDCSTTVDLFACETGMAVSEICYLLDGRLSPIVKRRVEQEVERRLLQPYRERDLMFHKDNWSAVCAGCIGMAALYWGGMEAYKKIDHKVMASICDFLDSYEEDGCCLEGALYWGYGFGYFCYFAALLRDYTNGERDLFRTEKVKQIALFRQKIYLEKNVVIPFADAPHNCNYHLGLIHFLAKEYEEAEVPDEAYGVWFDDDIRHRFADFIRDFYWYDPELEPRKSRQTRFEFVKSQWYINKQEQYMFAVKGGRNHEPHNHNDIGNFIVYSDGRFILDDLGWPEYDGDYFTEKRYHNICASSAGHSVPLFNGMEQEEGEEHDAVWLSRSELQVQFDLTRAYPVGGCERLIRSFAIEAQGVILKDEVEGVTGTIRERFVTRIKPIIRDNTAMIAGWSLECGNSDAKIQVTEKTFEPRLSICKMDMMSLETAYLIDFVFQSEALKESIVFNIKKRNCS